MGQSRALGVISFLLPQTPSDFFPSPALPDQPASKRKFRACVAVKPSSRVCRGSWPDGARSYGLCPPAQPPSVLVWGQDPVWRGQGELRPPAPRSGLLGGSHFCSVARFLSSTTAPSDSPHSFWGTALWFWLPLCKMALEEPQHRYEHPAIGEGWGGVDFIPLT